MPTEYDEETKLRYDVARILHTMFCHCGKPMSEYPQQSSWLPTADLVLDEVRRENYVIPKVTMGTRGREHS